METKSFNVLDFLKDLSVDEIKDYCSRNTVPSAMAMFHITGDFNLGTVIRNANFFGFEKVYYVGGSKQFDRRSTVGTHLYTPVEFYRTEEEFFDVVKSKYKIVAVENNINFNMIPYYEYDVFSPSVYVFGEEKRGISDEFLKRCDNILTIPSNGSVRSLNVGTASGIISSYVRMKYNTTK